MQSAKWTQFGHTNDAHHTRQIRAELDRLCTYLRPAHIRPEDVPGAREAIKNMVKDLMAVDRIIQRETGWPKPEAPQG